MRRDRLPQPSRKLDAAEPRCAPSSSCAKRHDDSEQEEYDQSADRQQQCGIDRRTDHLVAQLVQRLQVGGVAAQRRHQIARLLAGGDSCDQQCRKRGRLVRQRLRKRQSFGQVGGDALDRPARGLVALLQRERAYRICRGRIERRLDR
jgi:hypothetical protein